MDIIVSFLGGPLDGHSMTSDSDDPSECRKVQRIAHIIGSCLADAEKREIPLDTGLKYTVPSEWVLEKAKRENWSKARIAAIVPFYEYAFSHVRQSEGIAEIHMRFELQR